MFRVGLWVLVVNAGIMGYSVATGAWVAVAISTIAVLLLVLFIPSGWRTRPNPFVLKRRIDKVVRQVYVEKNVTEDEFVGRLVDTVLQSDRRIA